MNRGVTDLAARRLDASGDEWRQLHVRCFGEILVPGPGAPFPAVLSRYLEWCRGHGIEFCHAPSLKRQLLAAGYVVNQGAVENVTVHGLPVTPAQRSRAFDTLGASKFLNVPAELLEQLRGSTGGPPFCETAEGAAYERDALRAWREPLENQAASELRRALAATCEFARIERNFSIWKHGFEHPRFRQARRYRRVIEADLFVALDGWFERELQAAGPDPEAVRAQLIRLGCRRIRARLGKKQVPAWQDVWIKAAAGSYEAYWAACLKFYVRNGFLVREECGKVWVEPIEPQSRQWAYGGTPSSPRWTP